MKAAVVRGIDRVYVWQPRANAGVPLTPHPADRDRARRLKGEVEWSYYGYTARTMEIGALWTSDYQTSNQPARMYIFFIGKTRFDVFTVNDQGFELLYGNITIEVKKCNNLFISD